MFDSDAYWGKELRIYEKQDQATEISKINHTKGPWTSAWNGFGFEIVVPWPHETEANQMSPNIATVPTTSNIQGYTIYIAKANAAVIAAAPDLLEALEKIYSAIDEEDCFDSYKEKIIRKMAIDAIAKAKGQPCPT